MVMDNLTLDLEVLNKQIEKESLKPARCVKSIYEDFPYGTVEEPQTGRNWIVEWKELDPNTGEEKNFTLRSKHFMPTPGREVRNRRGMSYYRNVEAFGKCGFRGKTPQEFEGAVCWIREQNDSYTRRAGPRAGELNTNIWWVPVKKFQLGVPFESTDESKPENLSNLNPPNGSDSGNIDALYERMAQVINGKTPVQAVRAVKADEILGVNEDFVKLVNSGQALDALIDSKIIEEKGGKYVLVS